MQKLTIIIAALLVAASAVHAATLTKKAGEYAIQMSVDKNPPVAGKNNVAILVKDKTGAAVTDAKVVVEYSMAAMPGMPAASYKSNAALKGDTYNAVIAPSMSGSWNMVVKVSRATKTETARFTIDVK